jgi:mono/diheme cytochrome c family protein
VNRFDGLVLLPLALAATALSPSSGVAQTFDAAATYRTVCSTCHGTDGRGDGPAAAALNPKPADFTDPAFWVNMSDSTLIKAIDQGGHAVGLSPEMPAWGSLYDVPKTQALIDYIIATFKPKAG